MNRVPSTAAPRARRLLVGIALVSLLAAASPLSAAAVLIGDFEAGSLDGWSGSGNFSAIGAAIGINPTNGGGMLLLGNWAGSTPDDGTLDAFLGLATNTIENLSPSGNAVTEGSAVTLTISGNAGDVLTYDFNFLTREPIGTANTYRDFFFSTIQAGEEGEVLRDDALLMTRLATTSPNWQQSGWQSIQYTFATTGTFRLGFGVVDVQDTAVDSAVLIDNIRQTPEPSTAAMLGLGLLMIAARRAPRRAA